MARITKDPEVRRQEILDTAMRLFYENGYERTSMAEIAAALQVAQGLCYRYFPSKEALFDAAIEQYAQTQVDQMAVIFEQPGLTLRQAVERMPTFLEAEAEDSYAKRLCHGPESGKIHDRLALCICAKLRPLVQTQLELAASRGELRLGDAASMASFVVYGQLGILLDDGLPREERVARIKRFLLELLAKY